MGQLHPKHTLGSIKIIHNKRSRKKKSNYHCFLKVYSRQEGIKLFQYFQQRRIGPFESFESNCFETRCFINVG